ncbi:MAG: dihydrolipoamide acetyltransferase family protein, partial [bacterium]
VDILTVTGTGEGGRMMTSDIKRVIAERPQPLTRMRQIIAQRLTQSVVTSPHFYVTVAVDMGGLLELRKDAKARGINYTVTDFILEACILSLQEIPEVNSSTDGRAIRWHSSVHLGLATSRPDGLVVPVIRDAQRLMLMELHEAAQALAARARDGKLRHEEMSGSTFTVSNMGMLDVENFTAIINPGEAAILAVSSTLPTPVARDGRVVVRPVMKITLSSDHRLIDGATAARFVNAIKTKLEDAALWTRLI